MAFEVGSGGFDPGVEAHEVGGLVLLQFPSQVNGEEQKAGDGGDDGGKG